jgi:DNA-binding NarL/FixJ family response regulator
VAADKPYRVLVVEDDVRFRRSYTRLLAPLELTWATTLGEAKRVVLSQERGEETFAALLIDLQLPDGDGAELIPLCRKLDPRPVCLVLSGNLDAARILELGALRTLAIPKGLVDQSLRQTIEDLIERRAYFASLRPFSDLFDLSPVQREVLRLTVEGKTAKEVAAVLKVSVRTIETHWDRIFEKTGVRSKLQLLATLLRGDY